MKAKCLTLLQLTYISFTYECNDISLLLHPPSCFPDPLFNESTIEENIFPSLYDSDGEDCWSDVVDVVEKNEPLVVESMIEKSLDVELLLKNLVSKSSLVRVKL